MQPEKIHMTHLHEPNPTPASRSTPAALALALALTLGAPLAAHAADGLRVVRDPVTGELRGPNAAEAAAFERAQEQLRAGKPTAPLADVRHADGSIETKMGEDTRMYSVVREGKNGALEMECLPAPAARKFVATGKKASNAKTNATKAAHVHQ